MKRFILVLIISVLVVSSASAQMLQAVVGSSGIQSGTYTQTISVDANAPSWRVNETAFYAGPEQHAGKTTVVLSMSNLFTSVTVPAGATITSATFSYNVQAYNGSPALLVYGEDADNPSTASTAADGNGRTLTTANVDPAFTGTGNKDINVKTIVEEIIARAGWATGQNMQLFIKDNGSADSANIESNSLSTYARTLTINYTY